LSTRVPDIGLYTESIHHFIETLALGLAEEGRCTVHVISVDRPRPPFSDDPEGRLRLALRPEIRLHELRAAPIPLDFLFVHLTDYAFVSRKLLSWARRARKWGIMTENHYRGGRLSRLKEVVRGLPYSLLADRAVFQAAPQAPAPFRVRHRLHYAPTAHPQFLYGGELQRKMFSEVAADDPRRWRLAFFGNLAPSARTAILRRVQAALAARGIGPATAPTETPTGTPVLWMEYGEGASGRGVTPDEYIDLMTQSDFALSPPGYNVWTHRTAEAVLRGVIPIMERPEQDNLGLIDGESCIEVHAGRWEEAVARALAMTPEQIAAMRRTVLEKCRTQLLFPAYARRIFDRMTSERSRS